MMVRQVMTLVALMWSASLLAQQNENGEPQRSEGAVSFRHDSFTFVRVQYSSRFQRGRAWMTDYPDSDLNFAKRFADVTGLKQKVQPQTVKLTDQNLAKYPVLYLVEGGQWSLQPAEADALRNYLTGGGFLMVDDFWGEAEWASLKAELNQVFPNREPVELKLDHPVFHSFYEMTEAPQVPSIHVALNGRTTERLDATAAHYYGISNDNGRLITILCHNTDLGDGWEREEESEQYYRQYSLPKAYPMGINIFVYALSQ